MTPGSHARADDRAGRVGRAWRPRRSGGRWRMGTPMVALLSGALFAVSAANSEGTDLRPGRYTDLASLVKTESEQYAELEAQVRRLNAEVEALGAEVEGDTVERYRRRIERLEDPAGLTPRAGSGITVTLSDAPPELINETSLDVNLLIVHQQDIQAVVNAMWKGGATAVTVEGQRVITTTGIRCEGNSVQLQGLPYPQPYEISAVGNQAALVEAITADENLAVYRAQAADPAIQIGWELILEDEVVAPAYEGLLDLSYAEPIR